MRSQGTTKKKKSGFQNRQQKKRLLFAAAGNASNQKNLFADFKKAPLLGSSIKSVAEETASNSTTLGLVGECEKQEPNISTNSNETAFAISVTDSAVVLLDEFENTCRKAEAPATCVPKLNDENKNDEEKSNGKSHKNFGATSSFDEDEISPFQIPVKSPHMIRSFLNLHPIQAPSCRLSQCFVRLYEDKEIQRKWLSYNIDDNKFYCYLCMAFSPNFNQFQTGVPLDLKHSSTRIREHEKSDYHRSSVNDYIRHERSKTIDEYLNKERLSDVKNNRELVKRIITWILCVGRQGIAYRGDAESTKYFSDNGLNHGNLLEILLTASQNDELLKIHLDKCKSNSQKISHEKSPKGRGSRVTFLSKSTVNKIIQLIGAKMKKMIVDEVPDMYSLMVDSTQDITGHEQCSVCVRYDHPITRNIEERFIGLLRLLDTSGAGYLNAVSGYLEKLKMKISEMAGCSFDGASNMRSDEKGLQGRLKEINENLIYTWCYCHNLTLSVSEGASCCTAANNLFGLLQETYNFCSESYKRVREWERSKIDFKGRDKLIRFENIGKTRWYSKEKALTKIFGSFDVPRTQVFESLLKTLHEIKTSKTFNSKTSFKATALLENWSKLETILAAFQFLKIFEILGPLSKYLQTSGIDMMAALTMVKSAISRIKIVRDSFDEIEYNAVKFAKTVNDNISELGMDISMEEKLPNRRIRRKKRLPGEKSDDDVIEDVLENYRVNQFLVICDNTLQALIDRFTNNQNESLMKDMSLFHPSQFEYVLNEDSLNFPFVCRVLKIDESSLAIELKDFAHNFGDFKKLGELDSDEDSGSDEDDDLDEDEDLDESDNDDD